MPACIFILEISEMKQYKTIITITILILNILSYSQFAGGTGTIEDPYLIETAEQLDQIRNYMTSSFRQIADIDLGVPPWNEGTGWQPIGYYIWTDPTTSFRGNYDGGGYKILNMYINEPNRADIGLFGSTMGCFLSNINIVDFYIYNPNWGYAGGLTGMSNLDTWSNIIAEGSITAYTSTGLLSGSFSGYTINDCHTKGEIVNTGGSEVGGLLGSCRATSVTNSSAEVTITSKSWSTGGFIGNISDIDLIENSYSFAKIEITGGDGTYGGFFGSAGSGNKNTIIRNCYSEGSLHSDPVLDNKWFGGFAGNVSGFAARSTYISFINSYSKVNVTGNDKVGGFIGRFYQNVIVKDCYSTGSVTGNTNVGGFVGYMEFPETVSVTNSYWDLDSSGLTVSAAGEGRKNVHMTYPYHDDTYVDWDFWTVWCRDTDGINKGYPYLRWSNPPAEGVIVQAHIPEQGMIFAEVRELDISEVFADVNGNDVTVTVEGISDPTVLSADVSSGNKLILTAGSKYGNVKVYLKGSSGDYYALYEFKVIVHDPEYYTIEDFESGGFSFIPWEFSGDAQWFLDTETVYEGAYSARSGVIDHNQRSEISVRIDYPAEGRITYIAKASSERDFDHLKFYINDELKHFINGEKDWQQYIFPVEAGTHIFKWAYIKDDRIASGSDCVWIDYIVFEGGALSGIEDHAVLPVKHKLFQNYPNPFNPVTQIKFALADDCEARLSVCDVSGREVAELFSGRQAKGNHTVKFNAEKLTSGLYFYRLTVDGKAVQTRKLMLLK
jgi:hypothetical protein